MSGIDAKRFSKLATLRERASEPASASSHDIVGRSRDALLEGVTELDDRRPLELARGVLRACLSSASCLRKGSRTTHHGQHAVLERVQARLDEQQVGARLDGQESGKEGERQRYLWDI